MKNEFRRGILCTVRNFGLAHPRNPLLFRGFETDGISSSLRRPAAMKARRAECPSPPCVSPRRPSPIGAFGIAPKRRQRAASPQLLSCVAGFFVADSNRSRGGPFARERKKGPSNAGSFLFRKPIGSHNMPRDESTFSVRCCRKRSCPRMSQQHQAPLRFG